MPPETPPRERNLERIERREILDTILYCEGSIRAAAIVLGINERTVRRKLKAYALLAGKKPVEIPSQLL